MSYLDRTQIKLIGGSMVVAMFYGIAHDLVTAHVYLKYFTVYHPLIIQSESPIIQALVWGVLATVWVGLIAGLTFAFVNGRRKVPIPLKELFRRIIWLAAILWLSAMVVLLSVYLLAGLMPVVERRPSFEEDRRAVAVAVTHSFSYLFSFLALILFSLWIWRTKKYEAS